MHPEPETPENIKTTNKRITNFPLHNQDRPDLLKMFI